MSYQKLKPCPFCGRTPEIFAPYSKHRGCWVIGCIHDDCAMEYVEAKAHTKKDVIKRWNTRK